MKQLVHTQRPLRPFHITRCCLRRTARSLSITYMNIILKNTHAEPLCCRAAFVNMPCCSHTGHTYSHARTTLWKIISKMRTCNLKFHPSLKERRIFSPFLFLTPRGVVFLFLMSSERTVPAAGDVLNIRRRKCCHPGVYILSRVCALRAFI